MSSTRAQTRARILDAARRLLEERGYHGVGLEEIAGAARVSRQAVYLHFRSKGTLLVALVQHIDDTQGFAELIRHVREAPDALTALDRMAHIHAVYDPRILRIAAVLASARSVDADAAAAWDDRMSARRQAARWIVAWMARDNVLAPGWTQDEAADVLWALASPPVLGLLIQERGWSARRYERYLRTTLRRTLTTSPDVKKPRRAR